jgi:hypothetical protein
MLIAGIMCFILTIAQAGLEQSPEPEQSFVDDDDEEEPSVSKSSFTFDRIA